MFDIGFSELALIAIVALVVLGPERLPEAARALGKWVGRARRMMRDMTEELEREVDVSDLREQFREAKRSVEEEWDSAGWDDDKSADTAGETGDVDQHDDDIDEDLLVSEAERQSDAFDDSAYDVDDGDGEGQDFGAAARRAYERGGDVADSDSPEPAEREPEAVEPEPEAAEPEAAEPEKDSGEEGDIGSESGRTVRDTARSRVH